MEPKVTTEESYIEKAKVLSSFFSDYMTDDKKLTKEEKNFAKKAEEDLYLEFPYSYKEIYSPSSTKKVHYLENIINRVAPYVTDVNMATLTKGNSLINLYNKAKLIRSLPINKNDLDSLKKYIPNFYNKYNLDMSKLILTEHKKDSKKKNLSKKFQIGGNIVPSSDNSILTKRFPHGVYKKGKNFFKYDSMDNNSIIRDTKDLTFLGENMSIIPEGPFKGLSKKPSAVPKIFNNKAEAFMSAGASNRISNQEVRDTFKKVDSPDGLDWATLYNRKKIENERN